MQPIPTPPDSWLGWMIYGSLRESSRHRRTVLLVLVVMVLLGGPVGIGASLLATVAVVALRVGARLGGGDPGPLASVLDALDPEDPA